MIRLVRLLAGLCLASLVLAGVARGQFLPPGMRGGGSVSHYDPHTVVTVSGVVESITPPSGKPGWPYLVYLTLRTEAGKIKVYLAPNIYVNKLPVKLKESDRIQVTGSKVTWEGQPLLLAAQVKKGDQVLPFRRPDGVPYWRQHGRR
jgi:hypothetical protein